MMERLIIRMGLGTGETAQEAAEAGLRDAMGRAVVHASHEGGVLRVTVGVPEAEGVSEPALVAVLGQSAEVTCRTGGLSAGGRFVATVALELFVPINAA